MRFERWRGISLFLGTAAIGLALSWVGTARADGYHLHKTIPPEVAAFDYSTGSQMMAPPIPYGHYAKDGLLGCSACRMHGLLSCLGCGHNGKGHGLAHGCKGDNCNGDPAGCGLFGKGGHGIGHGGGPGHHHKAGKFAPCDACVAPAGGGFYDPVGPVASTQAMPAGQSFVGPLSQSPCGANGCGLKGLHRHHGNKCGRCHGKGCGSCGGSGMTGCGDPGCGLCNGGGHGGHGLGNGGGHGLGKLGGLFHRGNKIEYFVGAGGPVPLTPGYVPYVNPVRSPRDFFSFPPMNPYSP